MPQTISLDKETFKALAGETRVQILKELNERQKTQSELAAKLHLSAPTVNEHLSLLKKAGLVQEIDDGHKWKYFSLSAKGKNILNPGEKQILLVLSLLTIAFTGLILMILSQFNSLASFSRSAASNIVAPAVDGASQIIQSSAATGAGEAVAEKAVCGAIQTTTPIIQQSVLPQIALLLISALFIGLMIGYLLKKK